MAPMSRQYSQVVQMALTLIPLETQFVGLLKATEHPQVLVPSVLMVRTVLAKVAAVLARITVV